MVRKVYEFTSRENDVIERLGNRMMLVGHALTTVGVLTAAESSIYFWKGLGGTAGFAIAAAILLLGSWSVRGGRAFHRIVTTRGADIEHLMEALREVRKLYELQLGALVLLAVSLTFILIAVASGPGRIGGAYP